MLLVNSQTTHDPSSVSDLFSFPQYTWYSHTNPLSLSALTQTFNPLWIAFLGTYYFIADLPLNFIIASSILLSRFGLYNVRNLLLRNSKIGLTSQDDHIVVYLVVLTSHCLQNGDIVKCP